MKNNTKVFLFFLFIVVSCKDSDTISQKKEPSNQVEAKSKIIALNNIPKPYVKVVEEEKLKWVKAGEPIINVQRNIGNKAQKPFSKPAINPKPKTIGTDTFKLPKTVVVYDSIVNAKHLMPIAVKDLKMKDAASKNIHYLDMDHGLNSQYVFSLLEDHSGNIWICTNGGGVSKYNGATLTNYTEEEGLSMNSVFCVFEDSQKNIWFGTSGGGVTKFDGHNFTNYSSEQGFLPSNKINSITEDRIGNIWIATDGGLTKFDGNRIDAIKAKKNVSKFNLQGLTSRNGRLVRTFTTFTSDQGLGTSTIRKVFEDKEGNLWLATGGEGIIKFDGKSFFHYSEKEGFDARIVFSIIEDRKGNIWFGTYGNGVIKFDGNSFHNYTGSQGFNAFSVISILEDKVGNIWFGSENDGLIKFDGEKFTAFTEKDGLSSNAVFSIIQDNSGLLWLATYGGGVNTFKENSFNNFTKSDGLNENTVTQIAEDKTGNIWFAQYDGGVCKFDGESFASYTEKEGLSENRVLSILVDKKNNVWMGTWSKGVCMFDGKKFIRYNINEEFENAYVNAIYEDKKGNIWFSLYGRGVVKYDGNRVDDIRGTNNISKKENQDILMQNGKPVKTFTFITDTLEFGLTYTFCILEDSYSNMWFGTNGAGACKFNGKEFEYFTFPDNLYSSYVCSLLEDDLGNIWFGTQGGGVILYDGNRVEATKQANIKSKSKFVDLKEKNGTYFKTLTNYGKKEGLSDNLIWSMCKDNSGSIWLGTEKGINRISFKPSKDKLDSNKNSNKIKVVEFHKQDGLKGESFIQNSVLNDSKENIWWGGGLSVVKLDVSRLKFSDSPPVVGLTNILINEKHIDYRSSKAMADQGISFDSVQPYENYPYNLVLKHNQNHLTFHYVGIDWSAPHKLKYQYILSGLDQRWNEVTDKSYAEYRNIPYGSYTFKVRAFGESKQWSKPFEYTFTIHPPWWHTTWFRTIYTLAFFLLLYLFYRWRTSSLRKQKEFLEKTVDERTKEVVAEKKVVEVQKHIIEEKHKEITDSINYAERIQRSFLASSELLDENLKDYFVLFQPKDVVSGDFYWASNLSNGNFAYVTADSTGHGVPGAIMSILNISSLELAVKENLVEPSQIFNYTRNEIISRLKKDGSVDGGKDGMDASIIVLNRERTKLVCSAANNPVWIIRNNDIIEISPDKMPVGKHDKDQTPFSQQEFELHKGDLIYSLTDGMPDQFGGPKGKKYKYTKLKDFLVSIAHFSMDEQKSRLAEEFVTWRGDLEQVDDVCLIGVRI